MQILKMTEYIDLKLNEREWMCSKCGKILGSAYANYKEHCLIYARDPHEVHRPIVDEDFNFAPDPNWVRIIEYYCPGCGTMIETEYLPLGHPLTHDIEIDIDALCERINNGELMITDKRLEVR